MNDEFVNDNWFPQEEGETWSTGDFCQVPNTMTYTNTSHCFHDRCELHQQCAPDAFCCVTDSHHGCEPVWDDSEVDAEGWLKIFDHDIGGDNGKDGVPKFYLSHPKCHLLNI